MADVDKEITVKVRAEDDTQKATQSAKARLRDLQKQMLDLETAGQKNTDQFRRMAAEAGSLKDAIGDTSAQVKALASDTRTLDTFTSAIQGIAGGFAVAQGAAALFGEESEDVQKAMMKVQAALALVNGATAVANALNKDSALMVNLNAAAQRAYALAVGTSTGAMKAFRLALIATGIGAAVVAIGLLVSNWDKLTAAVQRFLGIEPKKAVADVTLELERQIEVMEARGESQMQIFAKEFELSRQRIKNAKDEEALAEAYHKHNLLRAQYEVFINKQALDKKKKDQEDYLRAVEAFNKKKAENDASYIYAGVDGLQLFLDKGKQVERELVVIKRTGVAEQKKADAEADALEAMRAQRKVDQAKQVLQGIADLTTLFSGKSEKAQRRAFDINKKASMGTAIIDGITATQKAFKSAPPPLSYILAAAAAAAAALRVKAISNQQFQGSSNADMGGGGGSAPPTTGGFASGGGVMNPNSQLTNPNEGAGAGQGQSMRAYVVESDVRTVSGRLRRISEFAQLGN
jgi:hypothetical protein